MYDPKVIKQLQLNLQPTTGAEEEQWQEEVSQRSNNDDQSSISLDFNDIIAHKNNGGGGGNEEDKDNDDEFFKSVILNGIAELKGTEFYRNEHPEEAYENTDNDNNNEEGFHSFYQ